MKNYSVYLVILAVVGYYVKTYIELTVPSITDSGRCPFCYGTDLCKDIEDNRISLRYKSFTDFFYNLLSVKNVFFGEYDGKRVVLKKLGHRHELQRLERMLKIVAVIAPYPGISVLKACSDQVFFKLVASASCRFSQVEIWTILLINVEPLILTTFPSENWPVPKLHGTCGLLTIQEYCGLPLNHFQASPWHTRAYLALQLLQAAVDFTHKHDDFRLYLTDVSPDNIAVDENLTVRFVDLEHVILQQKIQDNDTTHYSEFFPEEDFVYSEHKVCQSPISDHNVYAVCRLLLSKRAPWPMMANGLLHSPPEGVMETDKELFSLVEECVDSEEKLNRFVIAEELIRLLRRVIE